MDSGGAAVGFHPYDQNDKIYHQRFNGPHQSMIGDENGPFRGGEFSLCGGLRKRGSQSQCATDLSPSPGIPFNVLPPVQQPFPSWDALPCRVVQHQPQNGEKQQKPEAATWRLIQILRKFLE